MNLAYLGLKNYEPDLNVKEYVENDIFRILKRDKVYYSECCLGDVDGIYEVDEYQRESIVINSKLAGAEKLRTQFHETVHHYLDKPISNEIIKIFRSMKVLQTRQDMNAEMLSLVMMFPITTLNRFFATRYLPPHLEPYLEERLWILEFHKI